MGNSAAGSPGPWLVAGFAALCCSGICRHSHSLLPLPFSRSARKDEALKATQLGAVPLLSCCPGLECFSTVLVAMGGTCQQMLLTAAARNCVKKHCNEKWIEQGLQTPSASKCLLWVSFSGFSEEAYETVVMLQSINPLKEHPMPQEQTWAGFCCFTAELSTGQGATCGVKPHFHSQPCQGAH